MTHKPGGRIPLLSARPVVTCPAAEHHRPLASTKLYCLVTEARVCINNLLKVALGCVAAEIQTRDLFIPSPAPYHSATELLQLLVV